MTRKITEAVVKKLLERPEDFIYGGSNELMFRTWSIGPVVNYRDATDLQRHTGERKVAGLKNSGFKEGEDYRIERFSHFLVGWVEHLTYRVLETEGDPSSVTKVARWMAKG